MSQASSAVSTVAEAIRFTPAASAMFTEIMKQADQSPCFHIFAELLSVEAHGGLDGKHVADKSFIFYKFTSKGKSFSAGHNYLYIEII